MTELYEPVFALYAKRDPRFRYGWLVSRAHVQAFHDVENERRRQERERLAAIPSWLPGFDPAEHIAWNQPLPPPDYDKADEMRLMGLPVRIGDVEEMQLEALP